jgi:hypothetical protein
MARAGLQATLEEAAEALRHSLTVKRGRRVPAPVARAGLIDACGCAMSAVFMGVGVLAAAGLAAMLWPLGVWAIGWRVLAVVLGFAVAGKLVGMWLYRLRARRGG